MRFALGVILALALAAPLAARAGEGAQAAAPEDVVTQATAGHIDLLAGLVEKVPEPARERIQKAIEVSRRGGEKALEALRKSHLEGKPDLASMTSAQVRGLERAIQAIEEATDRATSQLETVLGRVPESAAAAITDAIDQIEAKHAQVLARLEGLLESGVSSLHPPARPEAAGRPDVRPARPETPAVRPDVARPATPVLPERPPRPDGRP